MHSWYDYPSFYGIPGRCGDYHREGQEVGKGDVLARIPQASSKTRDITGGLPRVAELFEARVPKDAGMLAEITGTVSFGKETKGKQRLIITDVDGVAYETLISKEKQILVHDGQVVNRGETIVDGAVDPHDILRLQGIEALARYIVQEVQEVYRLQGVKISDKHIEVIIRQMLRRVNIVDSGDTEFITGEQVERGDVMLVNEKAMAEDKEPARYEKCVVGYYQSFLVYRQLHFCSIVPRNNPRLDRGRYHGQTRRAARFKRERNCRSIDSCRYRFDLPPQPSPTMAASRSRDF